MENGTATLYQVSEMSIPIKSSKGKCPVSVIGGIETVAIALFVGATALNSIKANEVMVEYSNKPAMRVRQYSVFPEGTESESLDLLKLINLDKIGRMGAFQEGWNGGNGRPFSKTAIKNFNRVITSLEKQPAIAPTGRNSLYLEYRLDDKSLLAFEVGETRVTEVKIPKEDYSRMQMEEFGIEQIDKIQDHVEKFYGSKRN